MNCDSTSALTPILLPRFQSFRTRETHEPALEPRQGDGELPFPDLGALAYVTQGTNRFCGTLAPLIGVELQREWYCSAFGRV